MSRARALELELAALDGGIDPAALSLALRYRVSAERTFFKSLAELQRPPHLRSQEALRDLKAQNQRDKEIIKQLEAMMLKPPSEFVSQNSSGAAMPPHFVSQKITIAAVPPVLRSNEPPRVSSPSPHNM